MNTIIVFLYSRLWAQHLENCISPTRLYIYKKTSVLIYTTIANMVGTNADTEKRIKYFET